MNVSATLDYVPTLDLEQFSPGTRIKARRTLLGKTRQSIEEETDGLLYVQMLYRLETDKREPQRLRHIEMTALAKVLDLSMSELNDMLGMTTSPEIDQDHEPTDTNVRLYTFPLIDAGAGLPEWNDHSETITLTLPALKGKDEAQLFAVRVRGDSMSPYIEDGGIIVLYRGLRADFNKVVAVHIPDDGIIIKRYYGNDGGRLRLGNDNKAHKPDVFLAPEDATIFGVSIGRWMPD